MERINVAELLKDCPKGMELDCAMYNKVTLLCVDDESDIRYPIKVTLEDGDVVAFTKYGEYKNTHFAKCVIFPKGKTTWERFQRPFKDGDVVAMGTGALTQIFIFKEYVNSEMNYAHCYIMLNTIGIISLNDGYHYVSRLATGEEKKKLFDAIKANGYKWNAETKTLEKLVELQFKVGDRIKHKYHISQSSIVTEIKDTYYILDDKLKLPFTFQDEYEIVYDKFDINTLKPFDKVLARDTHKQVWIADIFSHKVEKVYTFACIGHFWNQCIPYEGNEHLLGTSNDCDKFYKTWE